MELIYQARQEIKSLYHWSQKQQLIGSNLKVNNRVVSISQRESYCKNMSLLYVDVKNHQNLSSVTPSKQVLELSHRKDHHSKLCKFLIDPQKILLHFQPDKSIVEKVIFQNNHSQKINFKIEPPKKSVFSVKCKKSCLSPKQSCQIFLFFSGQKQKILIEDEFLIILDKQKLQLHIPILCKPKIFKSTSSRKLSVHKASSQMKENESQVKQKIKSRPLVLRQRKTGNLEFNCEIDGMVNGFLDKFNSIHEFVKEKNVKKQIFIGEKSLSDEKHRQIMKFNEQMKRHIEQKIKRRVESRLGVQFSEEGPVIRNFQGLILRWNKQKNIPKLIYEKGLWKVQEQVRRYLVNLRFDKIHRIFSLYRQFQKSNEHNNLPKHKKQEIYIEKLQKKINKKSEISLELTFDTNSITPTQLQIQNDVQANRRLHLFEINPRIGFDNWIAIQESISYTHELMQYTKKQGIPQWLCHPKLQQNHLHSHIARQSSSSSKSTTSYQKDITQHTIQINHIIEKLRFYPQPQEQKIITETQPINRKPKETFVSRNDIKINQAYNLTSKIFSSMFSTKSIKSTVKDQGKQEELRKAQKERQDYQNHQIHHNFSMILPHPSLQMIFQPSIVPQANNELTLTQTYLKNSEEVVINELRKTRHNMEYLKGLAFSREQQEGYEERKSLLESVIGYRNRIVRKVPKEDKYQFDRLDDKAQHILEMIERLQKEEDIEMYKLKGEIDLQIPNKNKGKTYPSQQAHQSNLQYLNSYKQQLIGKTHSLTSYLFHTCKQKQNSLFLI